MSAPEAASTPPLLPSRSSWRGAGYDPPPALPPPAWASATSTHPGQDTHEASPRQDKARGSWPSVKGGRCAPLGCAHYALDQGHLAQRGGTCRGLADWVRANGGGAGIMGQVSQKGGLMEIAQLGVIMGTIVALTLGLFSLARNGSNSKKE